MAYKHVIRAKTKNLFDFANVQLSAAELSNGNYIEKFSSGVIIQGAVGETPGVPLWSNGWFQPGFATLSSRVTLSSGNIATVSFDYIMIENLYTNSVRVMLDFHSQSNESNLYYFDNIEIGKKYRLSHTFTVQNDGEFYPIISCSSGKVLIQNIQVELGSTATPYTPYNYLQSNKRLIKVSNVCQLLDKSKVESNTINGLTFTNNKDGTWVVNGTSKGAAWSGNLIPDSKSYNLFGHKLLLMRISDDDNIVMEFKYVRKDGTGYGFTYYKENIFTLTEIENYDSFQVRLITLKTGVTFTNTQAIPQLFDLTEMFGSGHEPATVSEFRQKFPDELYPYSPQCWLTSYQSAVICKTKNLFDVNNAVVINYNNLQETTDATHYVKDGIVYTDWNNASIGTCVGIKGGWTLPAGTYTVSVKIAYNQKYIDADKYRGGSIGFACVLADGSRTRYIKWNSYLIPGERFTYTAEIPAGCKNIMLYLSVSDDPSIYSLPAAYCELMIEQGSTATSYVPYQHL